MKLAVARPDLHEEAGTPALEWVDLLLRLGQSAAPCERSVLVRLAWLARAGLPVAAVMVLGAFFLGQFMVALWGLWLIAVSIVLMRSDRARSSRADREQLAGTGHAAP